MKRKKDDGHNDIDECRRKILALLDEYNCAIETDDYHYAWLRDNDTMETVGF